MVELREQEVEQTRRASEALTEQNERVTRLTLDVIGRTFELTQQEMLQRMHFATQRMQIDMEQLALAHVRTEASVASAQQPGAIMGPEFYLPSEPSQLPSSPSSPSPFLTLMNRARSSITRGMDYSAPTSAPASSQFFPTTPYTSLAHVRQGQAGPSRHPNQFHEFRPMSDRPSAENRFEDMGTVAGTPHIGATMDDEMDVEGMDLHGTKEGVEEEGVEEGGEQDAGQRAKGKMPEYPRHR
jgi:hypothetical protein